MNYDESMTYLGETMKFGSRLGLERMNVLMDLLGQPASGIPCIHIAGTNGKGSVTTMIACILAASGKRVGVYTSPYLNRFTERIRVIDGETGLLALYRDERYGEIPPEDTAACITEVRDAADRVTGAGGEHPTEFEIVTAAAFLHFRNVCCDFMVLETGLGGRLDSTNVVAHPLRCVITAIGYDHMDRLGDTIEKIAGEKAGIIKKGCEVVMLWPADYASREDIPGILKVFTQKAGEQGVLPIRFTGKADISGGEYSLDGQSFLLRIPAPAGGYIGPVRIHTGLLGTFQPMNCALAAAACAGLAGEDAIIRGIALSRWPGRMEVLRKEGPTVILDGAHNPQGALALRDSLELLYPGERIFFLCGVMKDKDYRSVLGTMLASTVYRAAGVCCATPPNPRALPAEKLAECVSEILDNLTSGGYNKSVRVFYQDDVAQATREALSGAASSGALLVIFGSLYMAGIARDTVLSDNAVQKEGAGR